MRHPLRFDSRRRAASFLSGLLLVALAAGPGYAQDESSYLVGPSADSCVRLHADRDELSESIECLAPGTRVGPDA